MTSSSSVEQLAGLKRRIDVTVPKEEVDQVYHARIGKVAKDAKMDGFRPGKVPAHVIEKRYGQNILIEVSQELIQSSLIAAVEEHDLKVAGTPEVTPKEIKKGEALQYSADFEIYPEITLADLAEQKLEREVVELADADIEEMVQNLLKQQAEWEEVETPAANGDRVTIDFEGYINGEIFENGSAKDFQLELGSKQMIPGFEEGLEGVNKAETREVVCSFPKEYPREELAGQEATFKVTVHKISAAKLPELTDEFAKKIGVEGGAEALKQDVIKNMQQQVDQVVQGRLKTKVMDKLLELNQFEVPKALIDTEIGHLQQLAKQQATERGGKADDADFPKEQFEEQALRRVKLGLLLGEVIKQHNIKVDADQVRKKVEQIASVYHQPEQVINWYYGNKRMLSEVESVVLEDLAVEKLLQDFQVEEKAISYKEATDESSST